MSGEREDVRKMVSTLNEMIAAQQCKCECMHDPELVRDLIMLRDKLVDTFRL